jgi:hypothetical protein
MNEKTLQFEDYNLLSIGLARTLKGTGFNSDTLNVLGTVMKEDAAFDFVAGGIYKLTEKKMQRATARLCDGIIDLPAWREKMRILIRLGIETKQCQYHASKLIFDSDTNELVAITATPGARVRLDEEFDATVRELDSLAQRIKSGRLSENGKISEKRLAREVHKFTKVW